MDQGEVAQYIPELKIADPNRFGICVVTPRGQSFEVGDATHLFTLQSISKLIVYGLALEDYGREYVNSKVGVEPTGCAFNALTLDEQTNRPYNPMVNAGAIATTDLINGKDPEDRLNRILETLSRYTGRSHTIDQAVFESERSTGDRNRALAFLMRNFNMVSSQVEATLDIYFQQCSILVCARDLAWIGATLANGGVHPLTQERAIRQAYVQDVLSVMMTCGMYDASGQWAYRVGLPAKSGVAGGICAAAPNRLGIGTFSAPLDPKGNSVRGVQVCEALSRDFGLHLFNASNPPLDFEAQILAD